MLEKNTFFDHAATEHDVKHWNREKKKKKVSAGLTHPAHQLSAMRTILIAEKKKNIYQLGCFLILKNVLR